MPLLIADAQRLSNNALLSGFIETIIEEGAIMKRLPFKTINAKQLDYNREATLGPVSWTSPDDDMVEGAATFTQHTAVLYTLGGQVDVPNFLDATMGDVNDQTAIQITQKAKAMGREYEDMIIYANHTTNPKQPDGLHAIISEVPVLAAAAGDTTHALHMAADAAGAPLSIVALRTLIDLVKPGRPDMLMMSRRTRNGLSAYAQASNSPISYGPTELGKRTTFFDDIPIHDTDWIKNTELCTAAGVFSAKTGGSTSSIFAVQFGDSEKLCGLKNGDVKIVRLGELQNKKDSKGFRATFYCGLALFSAFAAAKLINITSGAVVAG